MSLGFLRSTTRVVFLLVFLGGPAAGLAEVADFDDLTLAAESYWSGPDPLGEDVTIQTPWGETNTETVGSFQSHGVRFNNRFNLNYRTWTGFAYSNMTDTTTPGHGNQYSAFTGSGLGPGSDNYAVASGYKDKLNPLDPEQLLVLPYFELPEDALVDYCYVTNTTYAALSMLKGDSFTKKFGGDDGTVADWFKLTAYGADVDGTLVADPLEFYLADYRFSDSSLDYVVSDWELFDLSSLEGARRIHFNLTSSQNDNWGMLTPAFFALDNLTYSFAPVPEPASCLLMLSGLLLAGGPLLVRRRLRRG